MEGDRKCSFLGCEHRRARRVRAIGPTWTKVPLRHFITEGNRLVKRKRIIVMGYMGRFPIAGVIWQYLHYIVGLQRLGHEVYYIEDTTIYPYNPVSFDTSGDCSYAVDVIKSLADSFGFRGRWAYSARFLDPPQSFGLDLATLRQLYREADAILNVCGAQETNEDILRSERLVYVESDPGLEQIKVDQGDCDTCEKLSRYKALFTFGESVPDSSSFPVPLNGFSWLPTRQPVVIDFWKTDMPPGPSATFTTVANWSTRGLKDIHWKDRTFVWSKAENFLDFIDVPKAVGPFFEIATDIKDKPTSALIRSKGWRLRDPYALSTDRERYRRYIRDSRGEFTVAKDQYVSLQTGWFSDRSACYLAAGRPVITQETGFTRFYGGDKGLFSFSNIEEIKDAESAVRADYAEHSRCAYEIACEYFSAEKVLSSLLDRAGI